MLTSIPFGRLNRREATGAGTGLPDGTLVKVENARPLLADPDGHGPEPPALEYEPVGTPERVLDNIEGAIWAGVHTRSGSDKADESAIPARVQIAFQAAGPIGGNVASGSLEVQPDGTPGPQSVEIRFGPTAIFLFYETAAVIDHDAIAEAFNAQGTFSAEWEATSDGSSVTFTSKQPGAQYNGIEAQVIADDYSANAVATAGGTDPVEQGSDETLTVGVSTPGGLGAQLVVAEIEMFGLQSAVATRDAMFTELDVAAVTNVFHIAKGTLPGNAGVPTITMIAKEAGTNVIPSAAPSEANGFTWAEATTTPGADATAAGSLRRLLVLTATHLKMYDFAEGSSTYGTLIAETLVRANITNGDVFDLDVDPLLTASLANMGPTCLVAVRTASGAGPVFVVGDDEIHAMEGVPFPKAEITDSTLLDDGEPGLPPGTYLGRAALVMRDGSYGPAGPVGGFILTPHADGGDVKADRRFAVEVTFRADGVSPFWRRQARGIAFFVSFIPLQDEEPAAGITADKLYGRIADGMGGPWRKLATVQWDADDVDEWEAAEITTKPTLDALQAADVLSDDNLAYLGLRARTLTALNGRAVIGGATWDYPLPTYRFAVGDEGRRARIGVEIETPTGTITRIGEPVDVDGSTILVGITPEWAVIGSTSQGLVRRPSYPDRRAKTLFVLVETGTENEWARAGQMALHAPSTSNVAYGTTQITVGGTINPAWPVLTGDEINFLNAERDDSPRRLAATEPFSPYRINASRVTYAGDGDGDAIERIVTMGMAPSEGQFGSFDLLVLGKASMRLLRTADAEGGPLFASVSVLSVGRGLNGPQGAVNVGPMAVAASTDGVRVLDPYPQRVPLSLPMHDDAFLAALTADGGLALGWRQHSDGDELWIAPRSGPLQGSVFAYSFTTAAWYSMDLDRRAFFSVENVSGLDLYGIDAEGRLWREEARTDEPQAVLLETAPLSLGLPGQPKSLKQVRLRHRPAMDDVRMSVLERLVLGIPDGGSASDDGEASDVLLATSDYVSSIDGPVLGVRARATLQPRVLIEGHGAPGQRLRNLDVRYEPRRASRLRVAEHVKDESVLVVDNPAPPPAPTTSPPPYPS